MTRITPVLEAARQPLAKTVPSINCPDGRA